MAIFCKKIITVLYFCLVSLPLQVLSTDAQTSTENIESYLKNYINIGFARTLKLKTYGYSYAELDQALRLWYSEREFKPFWINKSKPSLQAKNIKKVIIDSTEDGLRPEDYYLYEINERWNEDNLKTLAELDLLLTLGAGRLAADAQIGRVQLRVNDLHDFNISNLDRQRLDLLVKDIFYSKDIGQAIRERFPYHRQYLRMKSALKQYREIRNNGGWKIITGSSPLKLGSTGPRVLALANLLRTTGDLSATHIAGDQYDIEIQVAVKSFQQRHGIPTTGEVHFMTLSALNVPVEERIQSLIVNLERWRWLVRDFTESKQVFVNIAGYELFALELSSITLRLPVVVGKPFHATPVFSSMIRYIEFNPYWNVPVSIASNEILPKLKKNPNYLDAENMELYEISGKDAIKVSQHNINWDTISPTAMRNYVIKQTPGKWNALGSLKFVFPNPYSVYLHDTANPELFSKDIRAFSHGCIRVSNPKSLAQFLLDSPEDPWTIKRVEEMIANGKNKNLILPKPVPLHITYRTAWVDLDQTVSFRPDIYKRDSKLLQILNSTGKVS